MRTMRAAVLRDFSLGIQLEDMPFPEPKPNQVLVRILASGICHTDLHAINGSWDRKPILPLIPGHEGVGVIEALGSKVTGFTLDQKVLIPWIGRTCRTCSFCFNGIENYCEKQFNTGYIIPGTHAEYTAADFRYIVPLANDIDPIQTAPLACAGLTAFETIKQLRSNENQTLLIMGVGGVGHLAIQYAKEFFTRIIAIDPSAIRIEQAKLLGAETYSPEEWLSLNSKPLIDAAAVFAADPRAVTDSINALKNGGTLALVGLGKHKELSLPWFELVTRGIRILGSHVGPISTLKEVVEYHHLGKAKVLVESRPLADIHLAMADLAAGINNSPRLVLVP